MIERAEIVRLEWGAASIAYCRLPAWQAGERVTRSANSSIGFSFTTQRGATVESAGKIREKDVIAGELVVLGGEDVAWLRVNEPSELIEIAASPEVRRSVAVELGIPQWQDLAELNVPDEPAGWAIATRFRAAMRSGAPMAELEREALVRLLYARVLGRAFGGTLSVKGNGALDPKRLARVVDYIEANLGSPLSLEQLAAVAALSPFHFLRSFRRAVGVSPHGYVTIRRMERARESLLAGDEIACVTAEAGYASRSWFMAAFRRHFGFGVGDLAIRSRQFGH